MELEWILKIVSVGIIHWILAGVLIQDLAARQQVLGRRKGPWAAAIVLITCFGSLAYLLFHPQIISQGYCQKEPYREKKEDYDCG